MTQGRNFSASCRCSALAFITPAFAKGTFTRLRGAILVPRNIHQTTWRHPRSKRCHCTDSAISRHRDARRVVDCRVYRSAECGTDHCLLFLTMSLGCRRRFYRTKHSSAQARRRGRFAVSHLVAQPDTGLSEEELVRRVAIKEWKSTASECLREFPPGESVCEQWLSLRDATRKAAEKALGQHCR